jgi:hypothetical protein
MTDEARPPFTIDSLVACIREARQTESGLFLYLTEEELAYAEGLDTDDLYEVGRECEADLDFWEAFYALVAGAIQVHRHNAVVTSRP